MDASDKRKQQLEEWAEVHKGLEEAMNLLESNPDAESMALCEDFEAQLGDCVARLNASESDLGIVPTTAQGLKFIQVANTYTANGSPSAPSSSPTTSSPSTSSTVCLMPEIAPYQVLFDGKKWYSCVIVSVIPPKADDRLSRFKYKVIILGYNYEEEVYAEELRRWELDLAEPLSAGQKVFAVHPTLGKFMNAEVDKLTPKNTVIVKFAPVAKASGVVEDSACVDNDNTEDVREVPISHVLNGKWYPQLRKVETLSAEDKKALAKARKAKKKEKEAERYRLETEEAFSAMSTNAEYLDL